ncbi:MAG: hypothetical protein ACM3NT_03430 [Methylocystaceae bacterium]
MALDQVDRLIIIQLQGDLPLVPHPFSVFSKEAGITEDEYLERVKKLQSGGVMRRLAAVLRHRESGYTVNAMLVWQQDEDAADEIGQRLAGVEAITHLYLRAADEIWPYNMYAMVHARNEQELAAIVGKIGEIVGPKDISIIRSMREYKKTSMQYGF